MGHLKKIFIVDDHPMFREGLKSIIAQNPQFEMAGEAGDGQTALQVLGDLEPDVILMDISLPDSNGIELVREVRTILPEVQILILRALDYQQAVPATTLKGELDKMVDEAFSKEKPLFVLPIYYPLAYPRGPKPSDALLDSSEKQAAAFVEARMIDLVEKEGLIRLFRRI